MLVDLYMLPSILSFTFLQFSFSVKYTLLTILIQNFVSLIYFIVFSYQCGIFISFLFLIFLLFDRTIIWSSLYSATYAFSLSYLNRYVERLLDRISNGKLPEDRRNAITELQAVVSESQAFQLAFGAMGTSCHLNSFSFFPSCLILICLIRLCRSSYDAKRFEGRTWWCWDGDRTFFPVMSTFPSCLLFNCFCCFFLVLKVLDHEVHFCKEDNIRKRKKIK